MGTTPKFQALSRARIQCTDVVGTFDAGEISACRMGGTVALHISTRVGRFVFRVSERDFVVNLRGPADYNRNPFRSIETLEAEAAATGEAIPSQQTVFSQPAARGTAVAGCVRAWELVSADLTLCNSDAAIMAGISEHTFTAWISQHHRGEIQARRRAAGLPLRPNRRAHLPTPHLKPGGKIL